MHKIKIEFGIEALGEEKPIRVMLDDVELSGVSEIQILSNDDGVTSVRITLAASVDANVTMPTQVKITKRGTVEPIQDDA